MLSNYIAVKSNKDIRDIVVNDTFFDKFYEVDGSQESMTNTLSDLEIKLIESGMDELSANLFKFSIYEAVQNAQQHGYNVSGEKIIVTATFFKPRYLVSIISRGTPLNLNVVREQVSDQDFLKKISGKRGFKAMYKICDQMIVGTDGDYTDIILEKIN